MRFIHIFIEILINFLIAVNQRIRNNAGWQSQKLAAEALGHSADLTERAWQLGEGSLTDTLAARRLAHEARLAARFAQLDASEARYRLLLDAHRLWPLDTDDDDDSHDHH